jgi:hypothetical protein
MNSDDIKMAESQKKASLPLEDTTAIRRETEEWFAAHQLSKELFPKLAVRDAVWDQWRFNLQNHGKVDYAKERRFNPNFRPADEQVFDTQSLVQADDRNPVGTVLRRVGVFLADMRTKHPEKETVWASLETRRQKLLEIWQSEAEFKSGLYYAACALRREAVFENPQLVDVGDFLCVSRGVFEGSVRSIPVTNDAIGGHFATQYFGYNTIPGGGLYRVHAWRDEAPVFENILENSIVENGRFKGRKLDFGAFCTPDLSYDGKRIAFAWTANRYHQFNVFSRDT